MHKATASSQGNWGRCIPISAGGNTPFKLAMDSEVYLAMSAWTDVSGDMRRTLGKYTVVHKE